MRMPRKLWVEITTVVLLSLSGCGCEQSDYLQLPSANGVYLVIERETNCGATDPFGTSILVQSQQPRLGIGWLGFPSKRVFLADVRLRNTHVTWLDNHNLEIVCTDCVKYGVAEKVAYWRDINITFDVGKAEKGVF
jgi:hypothetical protein